jgi:hypothetical protein
VSPVKYELGFYIPEDDILHSHRRENLKSYMAEHHCVRQSVSVTWRREDRYTGTDVSEERPSPTINTASHPNTPIRM